jgi:hypothetical protein
VAQLKETEKHYLLITRSSPSRPAIGSPAAFGYNSARKWAATFHGKTLGTRAVTVSYNDRNAPGTMSAIEAKTNEQPRSADTQPEDDVARIDRA